MATLIKRGNSYYLNYFFEGKQIRKSLGKISKSAAELIAAKKEHEIAAGFDSISAKLKLKTARVMFDDYLSYIEHQSPGNWYKTFSTIQAILIPFFLNTQIQKIDKVLIDQFIATQTSKGKKTATINKYLTILRAAMNQEVEKEFLDKIPKIKLLKIIDSKPPAFYSQEQLELIYDNSNGCAHFWELLSNTGLRLAEAKNLQWEHIKNDSIYIISSADARTKSGKFRTIPLTPKVEKILAKFEKNTKSVYPTMRSDAIAKKFRRTCEKAGVHPQGIHTLRHTFCSNLVMAGVALRTVQVLAGHASITTTERYAHLSNDHLKAALNLL